MATHKRKDAAALFELIDQSTLKVPKGGSLKIPAWWSGKTNPPGGPPVTVRTSSPPALPPKPATPPVAGTPAAAPVPAPTPAPTASAPPSIRPPAKPTPTTTVAPAAPRRARGAFVPQTVDPATVGRSLPERYPMWLLVAIGTIVVVLLGLLVYVLAAKLRGPVPTGQATMGPNTGAGNGPRLISQSEAGRVLPPAGTIPAPQPPVKVGRVVPQAEVPWSPNLLYLVMYQAKSMENVNANARFLAEHGVDVTVGSMANGYYCLLSVEGFSRRDDPQAKALVARVVEIGREHPEFKRTRKGVYDGAYYWTVKLGAAGH